MPAFRFEALDAAGKTINGLVEADNPKAARAQLRLQQLVPLKVETVAQGTAGEARGSTSSSSFAGCSIPPRWRSGLGSCPAWWSRACLWSAP